MAMGKEAPSERPDLVVSREPVGPKNANPGAKGSDGERAFNDAVMIVIAAWIVLFLLVISLRTHNI